MKPVKIAMMGMTHGHTRKYYQTLLDNQKLDWVASCAQDEDAKKTYELYKTGVPCYLDPEEMYRKHPDIEAVVIASANDQHFAQMKWCAEKGIHILSMKIPTFDMKEYDEMIAMCDKAGIVCQIELEMHYNAGVAVGLAAFAARHPELIASESELMRTDAALRMIWSNLIGDNYSVIQCRSQSGRLAGPWVDQKVLYPKDGGHGMLFRRFDGQLMLTLHQPNVSPKERMRLYPVELTEDGISLKDAGKERAK